MSLFCLGTGGWARGRGWATDAFRRTYQLQKRMGMLLPFPLLTQKSRLPPVVPLCRCSGVPDVRRWERRRRQDETELNFTEVMTAVIHRQSELSRAWMTRLEHYTDTHYLKPLKSPQALRWEKYGSRVKTTKAVSPQSQTHTHKSERAQL